MEGTPKNGTSRATPYGHASTPVRIHDADQCALPRHLGQRGTALKAPAESKRKEAGREGRGRIYWPPSYNPSIKQDVDDSPITDRLLGTQNFRLRAICEKVHPLRKCPKRQCSVTRESAREREGGAARGALTKVPRGGSSANHSRPTVPPGRIFSILAKSHSCAGQAGGRTTAAAASERRAGGGIWQPHSSGQPHTHTHPHQHVKHYATGA